MDFYTLQDFFTHTKGTGYVMMFVLLMVFIPFWLYLTEREKKN